MSVALFYDRKAVKFAYIFEEDQSLNRKLRPNQNDKKNILLPIIPNKAIN